MAITLSVTPDEAPFTTEISVVVAGLEPGQLVTLASSLSDMAGVTWGADGEFAADENGVVDVRTAASRSGSFTGVDARGLFWSMRPQGGDLATFQINATDRPHKSGQPFEDPLGSRVIEIAAQLDGKRIAASTVRLVKLAAGIETFEVRDGNLRGLAFRHSDRSKKRGAIMSLTGSGGGIEMNYAPLLASLGYDVFSLAYFAYEDLPPAIVNIPLEYFQDGFAWMRTNFGCDTIAIQGASRGGELSTLLAATFPDDVKGAIPIVPMYATSPGWNPAEGVDGPSWTLGGKEIAYPPSMPSPSTEEMMEIGNREPEGFAMTPWYRSLMEQPEALAHCAIPIENAGGPLLMVSGVEDAMWPSAWGGDIIMDRLRAKGFKHPHRHLALRETGHLTPLPNQITTFDRTLVHSLVAIRLACGGNAQGSARNGQLFWDALVAHYRAVFGQ
ncbi:acyl-CoA thioesterase/bile acid-CoA:amino acid N-acyltransferase family protein [Sphingosinicella microcystinivorans]|uniref:Acyl-CoA thioester hydrolase n=1 Tax=Sphingosinicella microcystinivorans TaxID=335406 RepID=A0AAD1D7W7_SPHMI|nr:acyl-CoA thioesterase/bile acid-CoA:amino acid N-acyltransferase family protein [Sphingosinicella microcystinivorans]RKS86591.1 acyl-CoA thioester hydrolase/bile acid acetyltransferase-like protein [Sphingosinicella microcystinivorans]BBE35300.1 acyl-CoA thioester hydrolase [Sphingosinicella microcystinivorans]